MHHARAIALLLTMSPASAMAGNEAPKISDEQIACAATATKEFETTKAQIISRATANGTILSVDDTIAKRRLEEVFCKRSAACLSSNVDASARENIMALTFAACLDYEAGVKR